MKSYTTRDVARLLGLSEAQVRSHARVGYLKPDRGPRNAYRFSFQDLVLLRAAKTLSEARLGPRRILRALRSLSRQFPLGRSLDRHVSARVNLGRWLQEDGHPAEAIGQYRAALAAQPLHPAAAFNLGTALEELGRPAEAIAAYRRALEADGDFADAHFNLARLYEQIGKRSAALRHLRAYQTLSESSVI